jgi:metal-responsive CopG/Arc/MetJ family transcriptional regulator
MSTTTVNISFQKALLSDIDTVARKESRSRSELLREAARMYIERRKRWDEIFAYGESRAVENKLTEADVEREIAASRKNRRQKS